MLNKLYKKLTLVKLPIWVKVLLSLIFVCLTIVINELGQNFCQPVPWFSELLILIGVCFIAYPMLYRFKKIQKIVLAISSLLLWVHFFAMIFSINGIYNDGLMPIGLLFVAYILFFPTLILLITLRRIERNWFRGFRVSFAVLHIIVLLLFILALFNYYVTSKQIQSAKTINQYQEIKNQSAISNYFVERIVGLHFIYHTRLCVYDGWRPPLLDPIISLGCTFFGDPLSEIRNPILDNLESRIMIYKALYPNKPIAQSCKCSQATPENYYIDMRKYD